MKNLNFCWVKVWKIYGFVWVKLLVKQKSNTYNNCVIFEHVFNYEKISIKGAINMNDNKKVVIQNLIDINGLDESFYLALLNCIMEHRKNKEQGSKK